MLLLAVLAGCDKPKEEPKPTPTPTPTPTPPPAPADAATAPTETACDALLVFLETGGTWIGAPPDVSCFSEGRDLSWLKTTLNTLQSKLGTCKPALEVAAANGVSYRDIIAAMDASLSAGLVNVGLSNPVDLSMKFTANKQPKCDGALATKPSGKTVKAPARLQTGKDELKAAPLVIITKTDIMLDKETILSVEDALKESNKHVIPELQRAIPAGAKMAILQADEGTDAKVINRVIASTKAAGVDDLLFAVKNK